MCSFPFHKNSLLLGQLLLLKIANTESLLCCCLFLSIYEQGGVIFLASLHANSQHDLELPNPAGLKSTRNIQLVEPTVKAKQDEAAFSCSAANKWNQISHELRCD